MLSGHEQTADEAAQKGERDRDEVEHKIKLADDQFHFNEWAQVDGGLRGVKGYVDFAVPIEESLLTIKGREGRFDHPMPINYRLEGFNCISVFH
jgi:hypothetical protein